MPAAEAQACSPTVIAWYRSPLDKADYRSLHQRSDLRGAVQTLGYLGIITLTGSAVLFAAGRAPVWVVLLLLFLHGTVFAFQINAVHELGHGTVFRTRALNTFFVHIFAFLGWINFEMFNTSHARHHRYTLHQPDDLEVVLPFRLMLRDFVLTSVINPHGMLKKITETVRVALGQFRGEWETKLFPPGSAERTAARRWAWTMLLGHTSIIVVSCALHLWLVPLVITFGSLYGEWLLFLCNNPQHIGLQDDVPDFRLCCRTFTAPRWVEFLYWHMNYHIEHHMYAAVPCYRLAHLHRLIQLDLPPCQHGLIATWREIAEIQKKQDADPEYQHVAPLPAGGN
jgi:fatty acid desaturase